MHIVDHLFILLLFVAQPVLGHIAYRRYLQKIHAGTASDPVSLYTQTAILEWAVLFALLTSWYLLNRQLADLGFVAPGGLPFYVGIVLVGLLCAYLLHACRKVAALSPEQKQKQAAAMGELVHFLPRNERHYRYFFGVSLTAGVVEEIVYRGFAIWYLAHFMPVWGAIVLSSVFFGLAHSYQGAPGVLRTALVGFAFAWLYIYTGSLWLPIVGHALFDILQGRIIVTILSDVRVDTLATGAHGKGCCASS